MEEIDLSKSKHTKILVFAGKFKQFQDFVYGKDREQFKYISDAWAVRGMRGCFFVRIGTWYDRHDRPEIEKEIICNELREVKAP